MKKKIDCNVTTGAKINYKISKSQFLRKSAFLIGWGGVWLDVLGLANTSGQNIKEKLNFYTFMRIKSLTVEIHVVLSFW